MEIDKLIERWQDKHFDLLSDYSKGNANNQVMQMYRSQMKNMLDFIAELQQIQKDTILISEKKQMDFISNLEIARDEHPKLSAEWCELDTEINTLLKFVKTCKK